MKQKSEILRRRFAVPQDETSLSLPRQIARESITLVRNEDNLIPIQSKKHSVLAVCVDYSPLTLVEESSLNGTGLQPLLLPHCAKLQFEKVPLEPKEEAISPLLAKANKADLLLIFTYNAHSHPEQAALVRALLRTGKKQVVCPLRNPYDVSLFPEAKQCLLSYGFREASLKALVEVLFGEAPAKGKCPVSFNVARRSLLVARKKLKIRATSDEQRATNKSPKMCGINYDHP
jgi:beta-N-acetylhexosaminidase